MDQRIIDLYDRFTHGRMNRRDFFDKLAELAGSTAAATALLPLLQNDYSRAAQVTPEDPRLVAEPAHYVVDGVQITGDLARPASGQRFPAVLVIHENRGLNPHIRNVTRRVALDGFLAFGVDLLSAQGGTPADEDKARDMIGALDPVVTLRQAAAAVSFLAAHPRSTGKVGTVGFCWGGGMVNNLATVSKDLAAGVAYYGRQPPLEAVPNINAPLLLHYAGVDTAINAGIKAYEAALRAAGKPYTIYMYDGVNHAFNNDTSPSRYDPAAAALAWSRTIAFLKQHLA